MKRSLLAVAALIVLPMAAQAQTQTGNINATATVATVLAWGASTPVAFGSIQPGAAATAQGSIQIRRNVGVIFSLPDGATTGLLTHSAGAATGTIQPSWTSCGIGATATTIGGTTGFSACDGSATLTLTRPTGVVTEYMIFNGSIGTTQTDIAPGSYTGVIKINVVQN